METLLTYLFVFISFGFVGWLIEVAYRSFRLKKLVNPGFMTGCFLPIYAIGCTILYLVTHTLPISTGYNYLDIIIRCIIGTVLMTLIEFIGGFVSLKFYHTRLWDYSMRKGNIMGLICPTFTIIWGLLTVLFYFAFSTWLDKVGTFIYNHNALYLLLGFAYGIFIVDLFYSLHVMDRLRKYANSIKNTINLQKFKTDIITRLNNGKSKTLQVFYEFRIRHNIMTNIASLVKNKDENKNIEEKEETKE